jgi:hypothetical protein
MRTAAAATAFALSLVLGAHPAGSADGPPAFSTSWYVNTTAGETDAKLHAWAYSTGYALGQQPRGTSTFVFLDFGQPWKSGNSYGTWSFDATHGRFVSTAAIRDVVKAYILGFFLGTGTGSTAKIWVGVGTNNYGPYVTADHGRAWGNMMVSIASWLQTSGFASRVYLRSANDIELGFSSPPAVAAWFSGYSNVRGAAYNYNYGDAQGCPQTGTSAVSKPCGSSKPGWTQDKVVLLQALWFPEIYATSGANAKQWQQLALYSKLKRSWLPTVFGALSQRQACDQRRGCTGTDNTPAQAWTQITTRLASDPRTSGAFPVFHSSDIRWRK